MDFIVVALGIYVMVGLLLLSANLDIVDRQQIAKHLAVFCLLWPAMLVMMLYDALRLRL